MTSPPPNSTFEVEPRALHCPRPVSLGEPTDAIDRILRLAGTSADACAAFLYTDRTDSADKDQGAGGQDGAPLVRSWGSATASLPALVSLAYSHLRRLPVAWSVEDGRTASLQGASTLGESPGLIACVAVPIDRGERYPIGMLCVLDDRPRRWSEADFAPLHDLAALAGRELQHQQREEEWRQASAAGTTGREQLEEQLRQAQKMEAVGQIAGGIAHDFNNLLTIILCYSEFLLCDVSATAHVRDDLNEIKKAADRAAVLTRQLLSFSRRQLLQPKVLDLHLVVADMERLLRRLLGEAIDLVVQSEVSVGFVEVDPSHLEQMILNLVVNARDAMPRGGTLTVTTGNAQLDEDYALRHEGVAPGAYVMLSVSDTGHGMDDETCRRVFEPFFTTKKSGKGTGLGLATVYGTVKQCQGSVVVRSAPKRGTTFTVYLPRRAHHTPTGETLRPLSRPAEGAETILLVEDETAIRLLAGRILRERGYIVLDASNAGEALLTCEQHQGPIHLLLTDVVLPRVNGYELAERLAILRPDMRTVFMSGYSDEAIPPSGFAPQASLPFVAKPFTSATLTSMVRETLGRSEERVSLYDLARRTTVP